MLGVDECLKFCLLLKASRIFLRFLGVFLDRRNDFASRISEFGKKNFDRVFVSLGIYVYEFFQVEFLGKTKSEFLNDLLLQKLLSN